MVAADFRALLAVGAAAGSPGDSYGLGAKTVSANFGTRDGECLRLERNDALWRAWIVALRSCFRASAGVLVRNILGAVGSGANNSIQPQGFVIGNVVSF